MHASSLIQSFASPIVLLIPFAAAVRCVDASTVAGEGDAQPAAAAADDGNAEPTKHGQWTTDGMRARRVHEWTAVWIPSVSC